MLDLHLNATAAPLAIVAGLVDVNGSARPVTYALRADNGAAAESPWQTKRTGTMLAVGSLHRADGEGARASHRAVSAATA